jgi:hypothetical protein
MGFPAMSARGFPGSLLDPNRAGMIPATFFSLISTGFPIKNGFRDYCISGTEMLILETMISLPESNGINNQLPGKFHWFPAPITFLSAPVLCKDAVRQINRKQQKRSFVYNGLRYKTVELTIREFLLCL